ncbi:L-seryl-tRNA(Sec) selenium transferase [Bacillus timonensis]|nr:L-seryl-tRNA(Sec) selenium transferase [Bacillus timonensis]
MKEFVRFLPPIHELQKHSNLSKIVHTYDLSEESVIELVKAELDKIRTGILSGTFQGSEPSKSFFIETLFNRVEVEAANMTEFYLRKVINGTGTVLHTNLGRARLNEAAIEKMIEVAKNYSNLEYNITTGTRGSRHDVIEELIKRVTGAEAAMVVNNNAAAVFLILNALGKGSEVIVSRGQLVEIGGSFRVSSIMEESGAILKEVGTTNKTHMSDYELAINENTSMIMKVHTSNFKTIGFTKTVETEELVKITQKHDHLIFYEDLGSGVLYDFAKHGIGDEPVVRDVIKLGVDLVSFSGDKLLGGPQAGIIAGKKELISQLKKHQLARVLRVDKITLAALEATLHCYGKTEEKVREIPTVKDIIEDTNIIRNKVDCFCSMVKNASPQLAVFIKEDFSQVGGGTMPDVQLPTVVVEITHPVKSSHELAKQLRDHSPSIVCRIKQEKIILDFRTISEEDIPLIVRAFNQI